VKTTLRYETVVLRGRNNKVHEFDGALLGSASSRKDDHTDHPGRWAAKTEKCSTCRWLTVEIYRRRSPATDAGPVTYDYVVHTVGDSAVPGEIRFSRVSYTTSPYELIELLTVRRAGTTPFIAPQSSYALAQAADIDDGIQEAYVNRAVV
jgi:hypothetical protein